MFCLGRVKNVWLFEVSLVFSIENFAFDVLPKFALVQDKFFLFLFFSQVFLLSKILVVLVKGFYGRLFKEVNFCACITDFKSGNFLPEGELTIETNMFSDKILFINFHFILDNNQGIQELFLTHVGFVFGALLENIDKLFFF